MTDATEADIRTLLDAETIAVVGCSATPGKAAHDVPAYLQRQGYEIVPVNPHRDEVLGREAADSLADVSERVDLVDVFRPSEEVSGIVDAVIERVERRGDVEGLWLQLGIRDDDAVARARDAGLTVVQDRCLKVEHGRLRD
ncbi:CoA-binding protein [Haloplanus rubicundus]|uniref:CoA-binding protein n=1 Tax=Haloplanus rubicundus TaxID=1547898 RepID=A0A345EEP3_9EURY|nr:CoA-binding protein [Haloplanus rubicundus]AXG07265.1 CoA-binding protein [Haloplanus rubicundus]AXG10665.1 CoA-binding protein [Haloplanus rubicundus]